MPMTILYVLLGTSFGFFLSRSGAADYNYIQAMFLFDSFQLYGIIGTAVILTSIGIRLIKRRGRTASGQPIVVEVKPLHRGNVIGGLLFGIGWSITGTCPGPIIVNMGEGKLYAAAALLRADLERPDVALQPLPSRRDHSAGQLQVAHVGEQQHCEGQHRVNPPCAAKALSDPASLIVED